MNQIYLKRGPQNHGPSPKPGLFSLVRIFCILVAACFTVQVSAQQLPSYSYDFDGLTVRQSIAKIESGTHYIFIFSDDVAADLGKTTSLKTGTLPMNQVFDQLLKSAGIDYRIVDRQVMLYPGRVQAPAENRNIVVTGTVRDENGAGVPGAHIYVKSEPSRGTAADGNGRFRLTVRSMDLVLVVSYLGMDTEEIKLTPGTFDYNVSLKNSANEIEQVISIGYFNRDKDNFTGSAVVISGEELRKVNPNNLLQSVAVFDPSFRVAVNNFAGSNPNAMPNVNIRGAASVPTGASQDVLRRDNISGSVNLPTFILDGYEVSVEKIYDLDMTRVASVSTLKDAAATAVYGSRAANGVLIITTVAPKEGELNLSVNYELTANFPNLSSYNVLNASDKLEYERLAGLYDSRVMVGMQQQQLTELYYSKYYNVLSGIDTYWLSQPVRNSFGNKVSLFLEGGSETMRYGVSGQFHTSPGVMKDSGRDRLNVSVDLSYNTSNLIFKNVLSVTNVVGKDSPYGSFSEYVLMNPYYPKTNYMGDVVQRIDTWTDRSGDGNSEAEHQVLNPLWNSTLSSFSKNNYWEFNDVFSVEWSIMPGMRFRGLASFLHKNSEYDNYVSPLHNSFYDESDPTIRGSYTFEAAKETNVDASGTLTYSRGFGGHFVNSALGVNMRTSNRTLKNFKAIGFTNDRFSDIGFAKGYEENAAPMSTRERERLFGSFLSINYSYRNRYLLDLSGRLDGSSQFGSNNNIAPFWAAGIGWNLHNEDFLSDAEFLSQLRIKANTGLTGSVSFSPYQSNTLYSYNKNNWYSTGVGAYVSQYGNTDLKWQKTQNYDVGIDLGFLQDRFYFTAHYYYKLTKDMLTDVSLPASTGFGYYRENLGDIKNVGYELGLKANVYKQSGWDVSVTANLVSNKNKLVKISDSLRKLNEKADSHQTDSEKGDGAAPLLRYEEGQSLNTIYAVRSLGIDPENGKEIYIDRYGNLTYTWNVKDIVPILDPTPKIEGYFGASVYYKGFTLMLQFHTRYGGYEYNQTLVDKIENADLRYNVDRRAMQSRWTTPGQKTLYKDIQDHGTTMVTERFIQKDNLLELSSVYLSYDFGESVYRKLGMRSLRFAVTANDLWRASTIKIERGIDYPFARSITFSLQSRF